MLLRILRKGLVGIPNSVQETVRAFDCDAEGEWFEPRKEREFFWQNNRLCPPSTQWVPDSDNAGSVKVHEGSRRRGMDSAFHIPCPRHGESLTVNRPYGH